MILVKAAIRKMFRNVVNIRVETRKKEQGEGIDVWVRLSSKKILKIEHKVRPFILSTKYSDIQLEYKHTYKNEKFMSTGWMERNLKCNYLLVCYYPDKICFLIPWKELRKVWKKHRKEWIEKYTCYPPADNKTYDSWCAGIPVEVLKKYVSSMKKIQVTRAEILKEKHRNEQ